MPVLECSRCNELYYSAHGSTELSCDACECHVWRVFEDEVSFARVSGLPRTFQPGDHAALLYTDDAEAADFCADYLREGLSRGERLVIAVASELRDNVTSRLPQQDADRATILDAARIYYGPDFDPSATAHGYAGLVNAQDGPVRLVCGPDPDKHLEKIREFAEAGFSHLYVHQVGPDQEGFLRFYEREILPKVA